MSLFETLCQSTESENPLWCLDTTEDIWTETGFSDGMASQMEMQTAFGSDIKQFKFQEIKRGTGKSQVDLRIPERGDAHL